MNAEQLLEHLSWVIRDVMNTAKSSLQSPHPLWSELNELYEIEHRLAEFSGSPNYEFDK